MNNSEVNGIENSGIGNIKEFCNTLLNLSDNNKDINCSYISQNRDLIHNIQLYPNVVSEYKNMIERFKTILCAIFGSSEIFHTYETQFNNWQKVVQTTLNYPTYTYIENLIELSKESENLKLLILQNNLNVESISNILNGNEKLKKALYSDNQEQNNKVLSDLISSLIFYQKDQLRNTTTNKKIVETEKTLDEKVRELDYRLSYNKIALDYTELSKSIEKLKEQKTEYEKQIKKLGDIVDYDNKLTELRSDYNKMSMQNKTMESDLDSKKREVLRLTNYTSLSEAYNKLKKDMEEDEKEFTAIKNISNKQRELEDLNKKIEEKKEVYDNLTDVKRVKEKLDSLKEKERIEKDKLDEMKRKTLSQKTVFEKDAEEIEAKKKLLKSEIAELEKTIQKLKSDEADLIKISKDELAESISKCIKINGLSQKEYVDKINNDIGKALNSIQEFIGFSKVGSSLENFMVNMCSICVAHRANITTDCHHMCMCEECYLILLSQSKKPNCPMCRAPINPKKSCKILGIEDREINIKIEDKKSRIKKDNNSDDEVSLEED